MKSKAFVTIIILMTLTACASTSKVATTSEMIKKGPDAPPPEVILGPGDVIDVKFRFLPELDYQQAIRPDGKISLQMVDEIVAAGKTPGELDNHLTDLYSTKLKSP